MIKILENENEFETLLKENNKVLVDFFAHWCGPCKMMEPILEKLESNFNDLLILKVNVDDFPNIASKYNINSIPNFFYIVNNSIVKNFIGYQPYNVLERNIK